MINQTNFIIRTSGRREGSFYIDYIGMYRVDDISKQTGIKPSGIKEIYIKNGAVYDDALDVYYFPGIQDAKNSISEILDGMKPDKKGRVLVLTEAEVEYIRQALINEGSNTIRVSNKIKDAIFKKLND
ncbi:hypothetical protein DFR58_11125 [Anaerobacterium chartisolvens]|uniref:Uncharacterized protein n=1 Tax=Anaerobacterium chartisolvens TaxID=1297424 RepID=A0A369B411_9FIRM|nr:hypothetical protein [Anaerobacterium chartisolvens]RCX16282.1 hypothetical protein DFR58_11125 [Anaerobacterium chartisolvens]